MKRLTTLIGLAVVTMLIAMVGLAGVASGQSALEAAVEAKINYQGRLTDPGGKPLDGTYPMRFQVHDDPVVHSVLWDSGAVSVDVDHRLFNVELRVDPAVFDGQEVGF